MASQTELDKIRAAMTKKKGGGNRDANEWKPDKVQEGQENKYTFFILPGTDSMNLWYYQHGYHWIDNKRLECPRLHDDMLCPMCDYAFGLFKETDVKEERRMIAKKFLPRSTYAVNIYFPDYDSTPEKVRGQVMWFSMPQTVYDICEGVIFRDGPGDGPDPEPFGIFYEPNEAYPFTLIVKHKGGFNNYESSRFVNSKHPISKDSAKIPEILEARHDIPSKFAPRDVEALQAIVDRLKMGGVGPSDLEEEEKPAPAPKKEEPKQSPKMEVEEEEINESSDASGLPDDDPELQKLLKELG